MKRRCPHCGHTSDEGVMVGHPELAQTMAALCVKCLEVAVMDNLHPYGLRFPTATEQIEIDNDLHLQLLRWVAREDQRRRSAGLN